jgi:hypothetical protein
MAMTKFADDQAAEHAKKTMEENKKLTEQSRAEFGERTKGKPTPTQEENDLAALGVHITEHDEDGSNPDPHGQAGATDTRHMEGQRASRPQSYATRQHTAAKTE